MKKQKLDLINDPIPHLIIKMAIPVSIGFFFHTMFNVVDTYFASQISSVAVAALTITFPIFFMIVAISSGTRTGATALIANAEGSNNKELAKYLVYRSDEKIKQNEFEAAELLLNNAIKQAPEYGTPHKFLGEIKMVKRDLVRAVEYWENFVRLSPKDSHKIFDNMESALFDLGRYSEVENFYRKVLDNDSTNVPGSLRLANVLNEKGEGQAAIKLIENLINDGNGEISILLMKLKLSLSIQTPAELGHQIDEILNMLETIDA